MRLIVHSSLRRLGHVEDGAQTVVEALMEMITPDGTLLMPSFNHDVPFREGHSGYYHPGETPTTNGAIPDCFWRMDDVYRSLNPTHPFAAWGKHARRYTEYHHRTLTMGPASPLGLLLRDDGYCLLLGVDYYSNTFHHVVEMSTGAPCLGRRTEAYPVVLPDERRVLGRTWSWRERGCPITDANRYVSVMRDVHRQSPVGKTRATLYRLCDGYEVIADILAHGKDGFPPCRECPIRPRRVPQTVPSDWNAEGDCLLPDSSAHTY
jgi:aminoglycoside N3'-acetyltransferase